MTKCWFCVKERHKDCMRIIPQKAIQIKGIEEDCSFDVINIPCECFESDRKLHE